MRAEQPHKYEIFATYNVAISTRWNRRLTTMAGGTHYIVVQTRCLTECRCHCNVVLARAQTLFSGIGEFSTSVIGVCELLYHFAAFSLRISHRLDWSLVQWSDKGQKEDNIPQT